MRGAILALAALVLVQPPPLRVSARARAVRPGEVVVLEIAGGDSAAAVHVRAFDRNVPVYTVADGGRRALVGIDLDTRPGTYAASIDAGAHAAYDLVVARRAFRTRTLTVDPAFVTPPESARERIDREAKLLDQIWRASSSERQWSAPFVRPVAEPANSAFGTRSVFNGQPRSAHGGADFLSPAGTPIHAPNAGRIVLARDLYFSGNTVVIDHGLGLFSMLAHLSAIDVHEGDGVKADQRIGLVGATGRVTGPHLHWAVRAGGARVDPLSLLAVLGREP